MRLGIAVLKVIALAATLMVCVTTANAQEKSGTNDAAKPAAAPQPGREMDRLKFLLGT